MARGLLFTGAMPSADRHEGASDREAFFELATDLACIGDLHGRIVAVNPAFTETLGWDREELLSRAFLEFVHPDDHEATCHVLQEHGGGRAVEHFENRFRAKDGRYRWLSWRSKVSVERGRIFAIARDVTAPRELEQARERLSQLVASSHDAITATTLDLRVTDWNAAAERLYGYSSAEMIGRGISVLVPDDRRQEMLDIHGKLLRGERVEYFRTERLRADGRRVPVSLAFSPILGPDGHVAGISSSGRDLTARLSEEAEAREQREALSHTLDAILFVDRAGRVVSANPSAGALLGVTLDRVIGASCRDAVLREDRPAFERFFRAARAAGKSSGELRLERHGGAYVHVWVALVASYYADGRLRGFHLFLRDHTERKLLESRVLVADRMASIGTLAAGVAHEINNPLAYLLSNLGFVKSELEAMVAQATGDSERAMLEELRDALADAVEGGERVRGIVQDLRTFTRGDTAAFVRVRLRDAAEMAMKMASPSIRDRAAVRVELRGDPVVMGNEGRMTQVLLNLLVNAGQAIRPGAPERNAVTLIVDQRGATGVVEVHDTGEGIPDAVRGRIFDPFFTTKPVGIGTGLGLSICHQLVTAMGGELTFESCAGKGTTFRVHLPAVVDEEEEEETARTPPVAGEKVRAA